VLLEDYRSTGIFRAVPGGSGLSKGTARKAV